MACKSTQTDRCEYISDEDIICELYSLRQWEGEAYRNHKTKKVMDEMSICCCQFCSLGCALLVFQRQKCNKLQQEKKLQCCILETGALFVESFSIYDVFTTISKCPLHFVLYSSISCWAGDNRAEDEGLFSGTLGTHLTLAYCWAWSTSCKHAEV